MMHGFLDPDRIVVISFHYMAGLSANRWVDVLGALAAPCPHSARGQRF